MIETTPEQAKYLISTVLYGKCKYCYEGYSVNKDGMLRKHKDCPKDYPRATMAKINGEWIWIPLDELAEIAAQI